MKKAILVFGTVLALVACKKGETVTTAGSADSATAISKLESAIPNATIPTDSVLTDDPKESEPAPIAPPKDSLKKDSAAISAVASPPVPSEKPTAPQKIIVQVTPQKVIKETKVVYKNRPAEKAQKADVLKKSATMEIAVANMEEANNLAKYIIRKNDGVLQSENLQKSETAQTDYLTIKISAEKFDYLLEDLASGDLGVVRQSDYSAVGTDYRKEAWCEVGLTLTTDNLAAASVSRPEHFGGKTLSAIGAGWKAVENILLFLLPFWPLYLAGGIGYYFFNKNKKHRGV